MNFISKIRWDFIGKIFKRTTKTTSQSSHHSYNILQQATPSRTGSSACDAAARSQEVVVAVVAE